MQNAVHDFLSSSKVGSAAYFAEGTLCYPRGLVLLPPGWCKVNIDGRTLGSLVLAGGKGIFQNSRGFLEEHSLFLFVWLLLIGLNLLQHFMQLSS